jgi:hypothetical protein
MQKHARYAVCGLHSDFTRKKLVDSFSGPDIELGMKRGKAGPNFAHHEVKPPAIDCLIGAHIVSATTAVIQCHFHRGDLQHGSHLGCPFPASKFRVFLPVVGCGGKAPSARRMCAMA